MDREGMMEEWTRRGEDKRGGTKWGWREISEKEAF